MTGILCSQNKDRVTAENLYEILKPQLAAQGGDIRIVFFTMPNVNLAQKFVYGYLAQDGGLTSAKVDLPDIVFNFSVQRTRAGVKKLRGLAEVPNIRIINSANIYNQLAVLMMLSSGRKTKNSLLSFSEFDRDVLNNEFCKDNFLLKRQSGAKLSALIYGKKTDSGFDMYTCHGKQYIHALDIQNVIYHMTAEKEWILLKTPDLVTFNGRLMTARLHMYKNASASWDVLLRTKSRHSERIPSGISKKIDAAIFDIAEYASCFFPDMGYFFADFVISIQGEPYFLNFGGLDNKLITDKRYKKAQAKICENIMEHSILI